MSVPKQHKAAGFVPISEHSAAYASGIGVLLVRQLKKMTSNYFSSYTETWSLVSQAAVSHLIGARS